MNKSFRNKWVVWSIFVIGILVGTVTGTFVLKNSAQVAEVHFCEEGKGHKIGNYLVYNNVWNKQDAGADATYEQCILLDSSRRGSKISAEWDWSWPRGSGAVKAYPEIIYGWAPWLSGSTNKYLPAQLSKIGDFMATYDVVVTAPGASYNVAFDLWITSAIPPTPANRTAEIMIWVDSQNMPVDFSRSSFYRRIFIDQQGYDFWLNTSPNQRTFIGFISVNPNPKGSISLGHFLDLLINEGYLSSDHYLADIEFGNEIAFGWGHTIIRSYSVRPTH